MDASGLVEKFTVGEVLRRGFVWIKTPMLDILVVAAFIYLIVKAIKVTIPAPIPNQPIFSAIDSNFISKGV